MSGPCMCGDLCCSSCGPAQGNWKCPICGEWATEGCDHIDDETGNLKAVYIPQAEAIVQAEAEWEAAFAQAYPEPFDAPAYLPTSKEEEEGKA